MTECRDLLVSDSFEPFLTGWLEFAGRRIPGVAYCEEWPERFTITRLGPVRHTYHPGEYRGVVHYRVCSDAWPSAGSWHTPTGIDGLERTWLPLMRNDLGQRIG